MEALDIIGFLYAILVLVGGIMGYVIAASVPSLVAGVFFGSVLFFGAYQVCQSPSNVVLSLMTVLILTLVMGYRYYTTGKVMPAGMIVIASVFMMIILVYRRLYYTNEENGLKMAQTRRTN